MLQCWLEAERLRNCKVPSEARRASADSTICTASERNDASRRKFAIYEVHMRIGFIGLGHMGNPMARNLLKHGHTLKVFDVVPDLVKKLTELGAESATSPSVCSQGVDQIGRAHV